MKERIKIFIKKIISKQSYERLHRTTITPIRGVLKDLHWHLQLFFFTARRRFSSKMVIHVYAVCYNEEVILPYFLRHYSAIAEQIVIFDNMSTDNSISIIKKFPKAEIIPYDSGGELRGDILGSIRNNAWKKSRGLADWVAVVDADEFLWHKNLINYLKACKKNHITIPVPEGFDMVSDSPPSSDGMIFDEIRSGVYNPLFCKFSVFNPNLVREINYQPGCHQAHPSGKVVFDRNKGLKLLHYRFLGLEYVLKRHSACRERVSEYNKKRGLSFHYTRDPGQVAEGFLKKKSEARELEFLMSGYQEVPGRGNTRT